MTRYIKTVQFINKATLYMPIITRNITYNKYYYQCIILYFFKA